MSVTGIASTKVYPPFYWTQEIWNQAWHSKKGFSMESLCAKVACIVFPILLSIAIIEGMRWAGKACKISTDPKKEPLNLQPIKETLPEVAAAQPEQPVEQTQPKGVQIKLISSSRMRNFLETIPRKIFLNEGSNQHDVVNNGFDPENLRPPACAYHALQAAKEISSFFLEYVAGFEFNKVNILSKLQCNIIILGTKDYFDAVQKDPSIKEAADLENIKIKDPDSVKRLHLHLEQTNRGFQSVEEWSNTIVEHLFIPHEAPNPVAGAIIQIALLENGKNEHMAAMCNGKKAIFFNSHYNEMMLTPGKKTTKKYLISLMKKGGEQHRFSYTLGQYKR